MRVKKKFPTSLISPLSVRKMKPLAQGHRAKKEWSWPSNSGLAPKPRALTSKLSLQPWPEPDALGDSRPFAYLSCPGLALLGGDKLKRCTFPFQQFLGSQVTQWELSFLIQ